MYVLAIELHGLVVGVYLTFVDYTLGNGGIGVSDYHQPWHKFMFTYMNIVLRM